MGVRAKSIARMRLAIANIHIIEIIEKHFFFKPIDRRRVFNDQT